MALAPASSAIASSHQEASFQDNARLIFSNSQRVENALKTLSRLGVDRLVIAVNWNVIAPHTKPKHFDASNPASYGGSWGPFDRIVLRSQAYGMRVNFVLSGGVPPWAVGPHVPSHAVSDTWRPSASAFGKFVHAAGERYSGHYTPPGASSPLPRVNYWSIWNEPNVGASSLAPQTVNGIEVAPSMYRGLMDAAWQSLQATGHTPRTDTILVGQLASTGHADPGLLLGMQPLRFLRALYCLDNNYRVLRGSAASKRGCPATAAASRRFPSQHPALFEATGWGHHPYHLTDAPDAPSPPSDPDWVTFADLPKLERDLDRAQHVYGSRRRLPLYLTEYGFDTNPPQRSNSVSTAQAATYLNQAEYIAWRDGRVQTLSQYLLEDVPLTKGAQFSAYSTGLLLKGGKKKPTFYAYRMPIWMPVTSSRHGRSLEVWGDVRPAKRFPHSAGSVQIQFQRGSRGGFSTVKSVRINNPEGYFDVRVRFAASGGVRLRWTGPNGFGTIYSRHVQITLR